MLNSHTLIQQSLQQPALPSPSLTPILDIARIPLQPSALAVPTEQANTLLEEHQAQIRDSAAQLLQRSTVENAIQHWRQDLLTHQSDLKKLLRDTLSSMIQHVPIFERARASYIQIKRHDLNTTETILTALKILAPPLLLLLSATYIVPPMYNTFSTATTFTLDASASNPLSKELQTLCPAGFAPTLRSLSILKPPPSQPTLSDYMCRELQCHRGSVLKGGSCVSVNCTSTDDIFDSAWGFCIPKQRKVPGFLWGESSCDSVLTWISLLDLACWSSYMKLFLPWIGQLASSLSSGILYWITSTAVLLLLLSFLRISWTSAVMYLQKRHIAASLQTFLLEAEKIALEKMEYRCFQILSPRLFDHFDSLQKMPPVQRAIAIAEMGFSTRHQRADADGDTGTGTDADNLREAVQILKPLYVKCVQDVLSRVEQRNLLTLVEADLVESKQFPTLIQWIEDSSKEFRDEVGRIRSQRALLTFQEDVRAAVGLLQTAART